MGNSSSLQAESSAIFTEAEFCQWLGSALPGDVVAYYRGHLVRDCALAPSGKPRDQIVGLARRAYAAYEAGRVDLVQRRHGPDDYSYIAIARHRPRPPNRGTLRRLIREANGMWG